MSEEKTKDMDDITWKTDDPHSNNSHTMSDYIENHNMLDIYLIDGTYAEGKNCNGDKYEIHAGGDGDSFNHRVTFKLIEE